MYKHAIFFSLGPVRDISQMAMLSNELVTRKYADYLLGLKA